MISYTDARMEYGEMERPILHIVFNRGKKGSNTPTVVTSSIVQICCWVILASAFPYFLVLKLGHEQALRGDPLAIFAYISFFAFYGTIIYIIKCQPLSSYSPTNHLMMPILHVGVILINTYLSLEYDIYTWLHCGIWLIVATIIYLTYGMWNSKGKNNRFTSNAVLF